MLDFTNAQNYTNFVGIYFSTESRVCFSFGVPKTWDADYGGA